LLVRAIALSCRRIVARRSKGTEAMTDTLVADLERMARNGFGFNPKRIGEAASRIAELKGVLKELDLIFEFERPRAGALLSRRKREWG
jgi:hypothetical protein